ncbi:leucine-rich repeat-containing protein 51-like [Saccostrea echinata]|uniref:leucine-rich repeat-containing protein 51-like n=1 Tax=Saccostrea echinata TaxID=191078 RepID=UPI002A800843|nr:leucine-rich repeat-containing protein 51-like [Saccostrea echinata]
MMSGSSVVPHTPKKRTDALPSIDATNEIQDPLDYSFCRLNKVEDALDEEPRSSPRKNQGLTEDGKSTSRCLRLNNNSLQSIERLGEVINAKFENPKNIAWIDLSFNELTTVDPVLLEFTELQILYLHGNQIADIKEVAKLSALKKLRKLTTHGNPLEKAKGYKFQILAMIPQLQAIDFSRVTKCDRKTAEVWNNLNSAPKKKKEKIEDD